MILQFRSTVHHFETLFAIFADLTLQALFCCQYNKASLAITVLFKIFTWKIIKTFSICFTIFLSQLHNNPILMINSLKPTILLINIVIWTYSILGAWMAGEGKAYFAYINIIFGITANLACKYVMMGDSILEGGRLNLIGHGKINILRQQLLYLNLMLKLNQSKGTDIFIFCCLLIDLYPMNKISITIFVFIIALSHAQDDIFQKYYAESRKIAQAMTLNQKVGQMIQADFKTITNQEKQTTNPQEAVTLDLGSLLINGNAAPTQNGNLARLPIQAEYQKLMEALRKSNQTNWRKLTDRFANLGVTVTTKDSGKYKIKFLLGTDAVHGDQHTVGNVLFPHNIGLSCSKNQANFQNAGFWTKQGVKRSGFNYVFAPTVAVSHNPQWGRFYQTMGQDQNLVQKFSQAYIRGLQDVSNGKINGVLATPKHYLGDGSTLYGCNEGNANVLNFKSYISKNSRGYVGAVKANAGSVMVSYSAINWIPNAINSHFLLATLRQDIGFNGFTISDYDDIERMYNTLLPRTFVNFTAEQDAYAAMINAGVDVFMVSKKTTVERLFKHAKKYSEDRYHFIPNDRLTDAVTKVLTVKMAMGLVEKVQLDGEVQNKKEDVKEPIRYPLSSSGNQYQDSLTAVRQSLVLLKNTNNVLPVRTLLSTTIKYVILIGEKIHNINRLTRVQLFRNFDNIGMQCGGWTVRWQGVEGNQFWTGDLKAKSNASSILDALIKLQSKNKFQIIYPNYTSLTNQVTIQQERTKFVADLKTKAKNFTSRNTIIIGAFGEFPYAESVGDVNIPYCKTDNPVGCNYNPSSNPYAPGSQLRTLKVDFTNFDSQVLTAARTTDKTVPLVSVLFSGRPMLIDDILSNSNSVIAAWLPGTSGGQGIIDAIDGTYLMKPTSANTKNTLSMDWPKDMATLQNFPVYSADGTVPRINNPLFEAGYGLPTQ